MKHARGLAPLALILCLIVSLAAPAQATAPAMARYTRTELDIFDTVITLLGYAESQEAFDQAADEAMALLREYNRVFDAYNAYDGLNNLWYVNLHAAEAPVEIPDPLYDLLSWCKEMWANGYRETNVALGAVLSIWHEYRTAGLAHPEEAQLPPMEALQAAAVVLGKALRHGAVDVQHAAECAADGQGDDDLGARRRVAGDVARKAVDVRDEQGLPPLRRRAAHAAAELDAHAGGPPHERAEHERAAAQEIEARPVDVFQCVIKQARRVGEVRDALRHAVGQRVELSAQQVVICFRHGHPSDHSYHTTASPERKALLASGIRRQGFFRQIRERIATSLRSSQ